ncbi:magnesium transporter CorA family protein [Candidatus Uhrbacteria bacterium]|nr:magnesium transporter CorA family protein [Candidatus Uhrbacteria bacterium]
MPKLALTEIKRPGFSWINVTKPGQTELGALGRRFDFLEVDLLDCAPPLQRPKLLAREKYLFLILLFPVFDHRTRKITPAEVDFFITKDLLVTIHNNSLAPLTAAAKAATKKLTKMEAEGKNPVGLLCHLLDALLESCFPMLTHLANDIDEIESRMTEVHHRKTIYEIFRLKTNIVNFEKSMQPHKATLRKLIELAPDYVPTDGLLPFFQKLVSHTKEIWDALETNLKTLNAIEDTHLSLLNFRANDIVRTLTIFAVIVFPLTLLAAVFGMNTRATPIIGHPFDFWIILGFMILGTLGMLGYFKWKKWL